MNIHFKIDPERLTLGDLIALEDFTRATWRERRDMLANNMTDEAGNYVDYAKARETLSRLTVAKLGDAATEFVAAVKELQNKQLPPVIGSG